VKKDISNFYFYNKLKISSIIPLIIKLRRNKYDLVVDLFDNPSSTSTTLLKLLNSRLKLGFEKENKSIYTHIVPLLNKAENHIIRRINQLANPFAIDPSMIDFPFIESYSIRIKNQIGINLFGSSESKFIGEENAIEFLQELDNKYPHLKFIIYYPKDRKSQAQYISQNSNTKLSDETKTFNDYINEISKCQYLITADTSAVHLASYFKIPCLVFYQEVNYLKFGIPWYPFKVDYQSVEVPSLKNIDLKLAIDKFDRLIKDNSEH